MSPYCRCGPKPILTSHDIVCPLWKPAVHMTKPELDEFDEYAFGDPEPPEPEGTGGETK